jgi:hypothetical protein
MAVQTMSEPELPKSQGKASAEHLAWLVSNRSKNQELCLRLYSIIEHHRTKINADDALATDTQALIAVVFSLWRAVFLADIEDDIDSFAADYEDFLLKLIQHNAVSYNTDRDARHWTFIYYLNNARHRLFAIAKDGTLLPKDTPVFADDLTAKESWVQAHNLAELAIGRLEEILR